MKYSTIMFDLDGTLTDSQQGITNTISRVLKELGHENVNPKELVWCVGPSLRESFVTLLGKNGSLVDKALELYCQYYEAGGMFNNNVFAGVEEALSELQEKGLRLAVVTGKPVYLARPILNHFKLSRFFDNVYGPVDDNSNSSKVYLLKKAMESLAVRPENCLYVGDRGGDVQGARENGIEMLAVRYGYGSEEELRQAGASNFANSPADWRTTIFREAC